MSESGLIINQFFDCRNMTFVYRERRFYTANTQNDQSYFPAMPDDSTVTGINSAPKILIIRGAKREYGALGGIRTHDLSLRRAALYPAELQAHKCGRIHELNFTSIKTNLVPRARVELARPCGHYALNVASLPFRHLGTRVQSNNQTISAKSEWWAMKDSNLRPPACKAGALTN